MSDERIRATSAQRSFLRRSGFEPWAGMTKIEAQDVLDALTNGADVPEGHWVGPEATEKQLEFLRSLQVDVPPNCLKGQASWLIERARK